MLGIRPEDLEIADHGLAFGVRVLEPLGSHVLVTGEVEGQQLRVMLPPDCGARAGDTLHLQPVPGRIRWMRAADGTALEITA
jgi:multiple sugar transport system ATP-binding protein